MITRAVISLMLLSLSLPSSARVKGDTVWVADQLRSVQPEHQSKVINALIRQSSNGNKVLFFAKGHYYLYETLHLDRSNLTIVGEPGTVFVVKADIYALLANPKDMTENVRLERFTIMSEGYGADNGGLMQINKVRGLQLRHVNIIGVGFDSTFKRTNGFATSQKTSGVIEHLYVEGMPKPGIYISTYADSIVLRHCIARKMKGYYRKAGDFNPSTGFAVTGSTNVIMEHCSADSNVGAGLTINVTAFKDKNVAPKHVQLRDCVFDHNSRRGVFIASTDTATAGEVPEYINFDNCSVSSNPVGIEVQAARHIVFKNTKLFNDDIAIHIKSFYGNGADRRIEDIKFDRLEILKKKAVEPSIQIGAVKSLRMDHVDIMGPVYKAHDKVQKYLLKFIADANREEDKVPQDFIAKHVRYNKSDITLP